MYYRACFFPSKTNYFVLHFENHFEKFTNFYLHFMFIRFRGEVTSNSCKKPESYIKKTVTFLKKYKYLYRIILLTFLRKIQIFRYITHNNNYAQL